MRVTEQARAKINLYLDVVGKRADGYHEMVTVMRSVSLFDTLTVTKADGEDIRLHTDCGLPTNEDNLVVRAAKQYFWASEKPFGVETVLEKRIPMQAGLGGGSADAAAMLRALNRLDGDRFSLSELCRIGAKIGADVPFCIVGGTALCRGIGELLTPAPCVLEAPLVIAIAGEGVSTPQAFSALDRSYDDFKGFKTDRSPRPLLDALENGDVSRTVSSLFNRFEAVMEPLRPAVSELKQALLKSGALAAQMSGSGPAVFGIFKTDADAAQTAATLRAAGARAFACRME